MSTNNCHGEQLPINQSPIDAVSTAEYYAICAEALAGAIRVINRLNDELKAYETSEDPWKPIATAPETGEPILCCYHGMRRWIYFAARAAGAKTSGAAYPMPTHWRKLEPPK